MVEPVNREQLELRFHTDVEALYEEAKRRCKLPAPRFRFMLLQYGAVDTARRLLDNPHIQSGFTDLVLCGCRELSLEALVLRPEYSSLFTEQQLARARERVHGE